jgi:ribonucleoside-diphosphate reductase alpha chain
MVDHPNIKTTTSLIDFVFRALAFDYLGRTDLVHVLNKPEVGNTGEDGGGATASPAAGKPELSSVRVTAPSVNTSAIQPEKLQRTATSVVKHDIGMDMVNAAAKNMQSDAPACSVCGHITIRSGTCYKCLNCGNSMGCS